MPGRTRDDQHVLPLFFFIYTHWVQLFSCPWCVFFKVQVPEQSAGDSEIRSRVADWDIRSVAELFLHLK